MRVLMVSWEFPPVVVGGLGRHVHALARELVVAGHDVVVLSRAPTGTDAGTHPTVEEIVDGVRVLRVAEDPPHLEFSSDLVAWTLGMGHALLRHALTGLLPDWRPDVVHAHDWLVAHPAITLADVLGVPLVATLHATEAGRHSGWLPGPMNRQVHSTEWWLAQRADEVITCSSAMRAEVATLYDLEPGAVHVVHNGIDPGRWRARARTAPPPSGRTGPRLVYFGRLEYEKGVQDLIAALPRIRRRHRGTRLLVAGSGTQQEMLEARAIEHRVKRSVDFLGHLPDAELTALLQAAAAVVLPSRYEPFGIVALEAAAVGATLVASTAGGLGELVRDGETGLGFAPGDVPGIADAVDRALSDPRAAWRRARAARARLRTDFAWPVIAARTAGIYRDARARVPQDIPRPKIPTGNLFDRTR